MKFSIISLYVVVFLLAGFVFWHQSTADALVLKQQCAADGRKYVKSVFNFSETDTSPNFVYYAYASDRKACLVDISISYPTASSEQIIDIDSNKLLAFKGGDDPLLYQLQDKYFRK